MCLIVAGARPTIKDFGPGTLYRCPNCHNEVRFELIEQREWFTFFFIPLIPYSTSYYETCPICRFSRRLSAPEFQDRLRQRSLGPGHL